MKKNLLILIYILSTLATFAIEDSFEYLNLNWWKGFNDTYLSDNLKKVYQNNYDLKNTELKIKANEQALKMQFAQELPAIDFSGDISRDFQASRQQFGNMSIPKYSQNNFYLPLTASYELDIWGKNRLKTKGKKQELEFSKQSQKAVYISLTSNFAIDYFNLIKADKLCEIQKELVETQKEILSLTKEKYEIGLIPLTELLVQEKIFNSLKEEENNYKKIQDVLVNNLKVYLAQQDDEIQRISFEKLEIKEDIPLNYNSKIIEKRPDYLAQEAILKKIGIDIKIAKREFLPNITLFGQIGLNAYTLSSLCGSPSQFFAAGILPNMDIFSGGRKLAALKMQKFKYEQALNDYQKTYISALAELNSALVDYKLSSENYKENLEKIKTEEKIYNLVKEKRALGGANLLDTLFASKMYLETEKNLASNKIDFLLAQIGVYKASGGLDLRNLPAGE